ncbi:MAG: hypothetical protein ACFBRM_03535 [Pikeienuella sp.]
MRLGIIETGKIDPTLAEAHGDYPEMMRRMLAPELPGLQVVTTSVVAGAALPEVAAAEAWLVTGSKHGVYDPLPWIDPLKAFLNEARRAARPLVGICFGHQILAAAFGGRAEKSDRGWGIGVHRYLTRQRPTWMADACDELRFHTIHQDQVTRLPEDTVVLAGSDFCPYAMLAFGDPEAPEAISIQAHPEFQAGYARDLLLHRRGAPLPPAATDTALETIGGEVDNAAFAAWTAAYLTSALAKRRP